MVPQWFVGRGVVAHQVHNRFVEAVGVPHALHRRMMGLTMYVPPMRCGMGPPWLGGGYPALQAGQTLPPRME